MSGITVTHGVIIVLITKAAIECKCFAHFGSFVIVKLFDCTSRSVEENVVANLVGLTANYE